MEHALSPQKQQAFTCKFCRHSNLLPPLLEGFTKSWWLCGNWPTGKMVCWNPKNSGMYVISAKCDMQIASENAFPPIKAGWPHGISHLADLEVLAH